MSSLPSLGQTYSNSFLVTKEKVLKFADLSGDHNPVHVDVEAAREYGFNKPVAHGAILLSEVSRIIGMEIPGKGAFWTDLNAGFAQPVYWNDEVTVKAEVIHVSAALNMVKLNVEAFVGERKVFAGSCKVVSLVKLNRRYEVPEVEKRTALITGGSRGLGLAITRELLECGYTVITISRKESPELVELKERYKEKIKSLFVDLNNQEELKKELTTLENDDVNIVIHAASPVPHKKTLNSELYSDVLDFCNVNLQGLITIASTLLPKMKKKKYGRIITVGTSFIIGTPPPGMYTYVITKEALWGFTKSLAVEFGRYGITANMVSPGMMVTDMTSEIPNALKVKEANSNAIKRLVEPDEVAKTIEFICSEKASFINCTNIPINGGKL